MADRIKLLIQKRTSLKAQITSLTNLVERERYDKVTLKLRVNRVTELYHAYEEFNDELLVLDSSDQHKEEFANTQDRFYALVGKVETILRSSASNANPSTSSADANTTSNTIQSHGSGSAANTKRRIKLSEASLPKFDGRLENWLSFKNSFIDMIDSQSDLSDIDKLRYLKSTLVGETVNKLKLLSIEGSNYQKAWELLKRSYEVKRISISRHIALLLNMPVVEKETTDSLSKLADDAQQHVASLAALNVTVGSEILVGILESKLPRITAEKWEETLERDKFPKIDDLYEFLYKTAARISKRSREASKRDDDRYSVAVKKQWVANKSFVVNLTNNCTACKNKQHPLFKCHAFKQLTIPKRIEFVRNAKLCYNCLRSHRGKTCNYHIVIVPFVRSVTIRFCIWKWTSPRLQQPTRENLKKRRQNT